MIAIAKREFFSLFNNVIGWLFVGIITALYGLYFFLYNLVYGLPSISQTLAAETIIFMFTVPILTMRMLSEDRRNKTDQLILTAPVRTWQIVLGKYLSLVAVFAIPLVLIGVSPLILSMYGKVDYASSYVAFLGFCLYGLMVMALGLFISSLTESVVISAVISFLLMFVGFMMGSIIDAVFSDNEIISRVLGVFDFIGPMDELAGGSLNLVSVVYYVSLTFLFLFFTLESIEKRRWSVSVRRISGSVFSVATIAVTTVIVIVVNALVSQLPSDMTVIDITREKYYSITQKTKKFLKSYDQDVTIYVVGRKGEVEKSYGEIPKSLQKYREASRHIRITYVDPEKDPTFTAQYAGESLPQGSLIVESGKRFKTIPISDMYTTELDYSTYSQNTTGYDGEGQITSALEYVSTDDIPMVYILEGHDEIEMGVNFTSVLEKGNYETRKLNLLGEEAVPEDAAAVIVNGLQSDLSEDDAVKLAHYIENGGKVLTAIEFLKIPELENYRALLSAFGVETVDGVVAELNNKYHYQNPYYLLPEVEQTEATKDVEGKLSVFSPFSVGLRYENTQEDTQTDEADNTEEAGTSDGSEGTSNRTADELVAGLSGSTSDESLEDVAARLGANTYTDLMMTSKQATSKSGFSSVKDLAESSGEGGERIKKESGDPDGPLSVGVQVDNASGGQLFVLGSTYLLTDASDQMVSFRNSLLFTNLMSAMIEQETEGSIVIPTKMYDTARLMVDSGAANTYGILLILVIPIGCLIAGILIWLGRRRNRRVQVEVFEE